MKCSDCKYFKTQECNVNPEGKDCDSAETFPCFESVAGDEVQSASTNTGMRNRKERIGKRLFWIGMSFLLISVPLIIIGCSHVSSFPDYMGEAILGYLLVGIGLPISLTGASLFFVGRWGETRPEGQQCETSEKRAANFSAMAIAALVIDLIGIVCLISLNFWLGSLFGLLGVVFGIIALMNQRKNPALGGRTTAVIDLILGIILIVIGLLLWSDI